MELLKDIEEFEQIAKLENSITEEIYKGNMYLGKDTYFQTTSDICISYNEIADGILYTQRAEKLANGLSTYYTQTKINKAKAQKVLGTDGEITIYSLKNIETPLQTISLAEQTEEDYYTITYAENIEGIVIVLII